jgi:hypothetical protein
MSRNRKSQSAAIRFAPALKALVLCLLLGGSGVGYVWQQDQIAGLGKQIKARESRLEQLQEQNDGLRRQLDTMRSPGFLQRRIQELNLGLVPAQISQVIRLDEPGTESSRPQRSEQLAAAPPHIQSAR